MVLGSSTASSTSDQPSIPPPPPLPIFRFPPPSSSIAALLRQLRSLPAYVPTEIVEEGTPAGSSLSMEAAWKKFHQVQNQVRQNLVLITMAVLKEVHLQLSECQGRPYTQFFRARSIALQKAMTWLHQLLGEFIKLLVVDCGQHFDEQDELTRTVGTQTEETGTEENGTEETGTQTEYPSNNKGYKGNKMRQSPVKTE